MTQRNKIIACLTAISIFFIGCTSSDEQSTESGSETQEKQEPIVASPIKLSTTVEISKSKAEVWEIAADLGNLEDYFITVSNAECTSDNQSGAGAERTCTFIDGGVINEVVTQWEEGSSFTLRASPPSDTTNPTAKTWVFKYVEGKYELNAINENLTEATISMQWEYLDGIELTEEIKQGIMQNFTFANEGVANGLKQYAESGIALTEDDRAKFMEGMMKE